MRVFRQKKRPRKLPEKLLEVRMKLGLSQGEMSRRLGGEDTDRAYISKYERGILEPPLVILLEYARAISTTMRPSAVTSTSSPVSRSDDSNLVR